MRNPYYESTIHRQIREKRDNRKERIRNDVELYGSEVLNSEEMQQAFEQTHHKRATVGEHSLRVTMSSVLLCYALRKMNIKVNIPAVVIASLCHDLGILGRHNKYSNARECVEEHPRESVAIARDIVEELPENTEEIIERHMWPLGDSKAPNSLEGAIVSAADKYTAVKDLVKGSNTENESINSLKPYGKREAECTDNGNE